GPRRERLPEDPGQLHLFDADVPPSVLEFPADPEPDAGSSPRRRRKGHGRNEIPDHLPRQDVLHDVAPEEQVCSCGCTKTRIGEAVTEQLDYVPGRIVGLGHIYPKYACSGCRAGGTAAQPVPNPIARCLAAPGLLAFVVVSKFSEHLPLYRQQDVLARHGIVLARSTLCDWLAQAAQGLKPLVDRMRQQLLLSLAINADETPVSVLGSTRATTQKGYLWGYLGDSAHPYIVLAYRDARSRDGPAEILKDFRGYLQTDAYTSYESVVAESAGRIIPVGCWAHARREFFDARLNQPREAHHVLGL